MGKKLQPISIRLDPDVKEGIQALAEEDDRSLSAYINRVLRRHIEEEKKRKHPPGRKSEKPKA